MREEPPADLLRCPRAAPAFPTDGSAASTIPSAVRDALIALAAAYGDARNQLERLIEWHAPGTCGTAD